jgi:predicted DNA-binding WGR domain protein
VNRRFELRDGSSSKFWEIRQKGKQFTTTYGRIGGKGRSTTKAFGAPAEAKEAAEKSVRQKMEKGYRETASSVESNEPHVWGAQLSTLIKQLKSKDAEERVEAARQVSDIGPRAAAAVPVLVKALSDETDLMRNWAAAALESIGPAARSAAKDLSKALKDSNPWTRATAAAALYKVGERAKGLKAIVACLDDPSTRDITGNAIVGLGPGLNEAFVPILRGRLKSKDKKDVAIAAQTLSRITRFNKAMAQRDERLSVQEAQKRGSIWLGLPLGVRQMRSYLPRGLRGSMRMSYFVSVWDRSRRALICFISAFVTSLSDGK